MQGFFYSNFRINYYRYMQRMTYDPYIWMYYENLISYEKMVLYQTSKPIPFPKEGTEKQITKKPKGAGHKGVSFREKVFTLSELAEFNGMKGKPAYVAVDGNVYDVSVTPSWGGGTHFGVYSGKDLTAEFKKCHSAGSILSKLTKVGVLQK